MTEQIKPKQCGEKAWYIPNQKGFVPENGGEYFSVLYENNKFYASRNLHNCHTYDYAFINSGNCFETEKEAIDAFVKPVDPTPVNWDELCQIAKYDKQSQIFSIYDTFAGYNAGTVLGRGRLAFEAGQKYWRSRESAAAWIDQQRWE